jgi:hypothetical protein
LAGRFCGWAESEGREKKGKDKVFSNFCFFKQLQIQTKFEFKPLNSSPAVKQRIVIQHECNKNVSKPYISFQ